MAIAYDNSANFNFTGANPSTSFTCSSASGRILLVNTSFNVTAATYGGVSMTKVINFSPSIIDGNEVKVNVYRLINPASGSNTLAFTTTGDGSAGIISYTGVDDAVYQPIENATGYSNNGVNNTQVGSLATGVTTTKDSSWVVLFTRGGNGFPNTFSGARTTGTYIFGDHAQGIYDSGPITPTGSPTLTATWSSGSGYISNVIISLSPSNLGGLLSFFS